MGGRGPKVGRWVCGWVAILTNQRSPSIRRRHTKEASALTRPLRGFGGTEMPGVYKWL